MTVQVVRPAGAGHETLYVLLICALILALAGAVITLHHEAPEQQSVAEYQIDARRDLSPAEQGIYADLMVVADEIPFLLEETGELPTPEQLAEAGFPPFITDMSSRQRGEHGWQLLDIGGAPAYLGRSQDANVAGSFLMRIGDAEQANQAVWLSANSEISAPQHLSDQALIAAGWKQLATQYDAGVTRHTEH